MIIVFVVSEICIIPLTGLIISPCRVSPAPGSLGREQGGREEGGSSLQGDNRYHTAQEDKKFPFVSTCFYSFQGVSTDFDLFGLSLTCFHLF